jgi:Inorganic pyrophosphatase
VIAVLVGFFLMRGVLAADQGTPKMREIAPSRKGDGLPAAQFRTIAIVVIPSRSSCSSRRRTS